MLTALAATLLLRQATAYVPAQTRVLVVAPVDASGDKQATTSAEELAEAKTTLETRFGERGFVVVTGDDAAAAAKTAGVDLSVKANRTDDNLYKIGAAANARLVVFTMVEKTGQKMKERFMDSHMDGFVHLRTWLLDVQDRRAILSDARHDGDSTSLGKAEKNRQVRAVRLALDEQLHDFVKRYPETKK